MSSLRKIWVSGVEWGWHTVEVLEQSVIYEAKDGKYGEDGSEMDDERCKS